MSIQSISKTTIPQGQDCAICLEEMTECVKTVCEHFFHQKCLDTWLTNNTTCPICRRVIRLQSQPQNQLSLQEQFPFFM